MGDQRVYESLVEREESSKQKKKIFIARVKKTVTKLELNLVTKQTVFFKFQSIMHLEA